MHTQTITRRTIKRVENKLNQGIAGLGQCYDPQSGESVDCASTWGTTYTSDNGSSSFWDNFFKLVTVGSTAAVQIIKADNQYYYTPQGPQPYGTGQYSAITPTQAQMYVQQRPGGVTTGGDITMSWTTIALIGMAAMMMFTMMRR